MSSPPSVPAVPLSYHNYEENAAAPRLARQGETNEFLDSITIPYNDPIALNAREARNNRTRLLKKLSVPNRKNKNMVLTTMVRNIYNNTPFQRNSGVPFFAASGFFAFLSMMVFSHVAYMNQTKLVTPFTTLQSNYHFGVALSLGSVAGFCGVAGVFQYTRDSRSSKFSVALVVAGLLLFGAMITAANYAQNNRTGENKQQNAYLENVTLALQSAAFLLVISTFIATATD